jgi:hypothetical protein
MTRRTPLPTVLATKYDREIAKLLRARRALHRAEDRLCKLARASAPIDASAPQHIRLRYEDAIRSSVQSEGMGPEYNTLAPFTAYLTAEVIPALLADAAD